MSDKINFKSKTVKRDKESHCAMMKGSIRQEDVTMINVYTPSARAPGFIRQILMDPET